MAALRQHHRHRGAVGLRRLGDDRFVRGAAAEEGRHVALEAVAPQPVTDAPQDGVALHEERPDPIARLELRGVGLGGRLLGVPRG